MQGNVNDGCNVSKCPRDVMSQGVQVASGSWKSQGMESPLQPLEGMQSCCHLDFISVWDSDLQNCTIIDLYFSYYSGGKWSQHV